MTYCYRVLEFINNWRCPVPVASGKKENVALANQILLHWLINPDPGKAFLVKGMIFIKVANLDHPVSAIVRRLNLFSKLVSNLDICDFSNLLFHMDLTISILLLKYPSYSTKILHLRKLFVKKYLHD